MTELPFSDIKAGDVVRVSFPPRGGMSGNWELTHSRKGIAYRLLGGEWLTSDGQRLVSRSDLRDGRCHH